MKKRNIVSILALLGVVLALGLAGCGEEGGYIVVKNTSADDGAVFIATEAELAIYGYSGADEATLAAQAELSADMMIEFANCIMRPSHPDQAHYKWIPAGGTKTWVFGDDGKYYLGGSTPIEISGGETKEVNVASVTSSFGG
jgi:hypothetical protein